MTIAPRRTNRWDGPWWTNDCPHSIINGCEVGLGEKMEFMWCDDCGRWIVYPIPYVELKGSPYDS